MYTHSISSFVVIAAPSAAKDEFVIESDEMVGWDSPEEHALKRRIRARFESIRASMAPGWEITRLDVGCRRAGTTSFEDLEGLLAQPAPTEEEAIDNDWETAMAAARTVGLDLPRLRRLVFCMRYRERRNEGRELLDSIVSSARRALAGEAPDVPLAYLAGVDDTGYNTVCHGWVSSYRGSGELTLPDGRRYGVIGHGPTGNAHMVFERGWVEFQPVVEAISA